jgi:hypothetical protein
MKKILMIAILIASIVIGLSDITNSQVKPDCEPGFITSVFTITINGCNYEYVVCFRCEPHHNYIDARLNHYRRTYPLPCTPSPPLTHEQILAKIEEKIINTDITYLSGLCTIKPCSEKDSNGNDYRTPITYHQFLCWKQIAQDSTTFFIAPCKESGYCERTYYVCFTGDTIKPIVPIKVYSISESFRDNDSTCTTPLPLPPVPFPMPATIPGETGCYRIKTDCEK